MTVKCLRSTNEIVQLERVENSKPFHRHYGNIPPHSSLTKQKKYHKLQNQTLRQVPQIRNTKTK